MFMDYENNEVVITEFYLVKTTSRKHNSKELDFRRHGDKRQCNRNRYNDGNFRKGRMPKCCENYEYTSVYQARFAAERALEDGFKQNPDSNFDFIEANNKASIKSKKQEEEAYRLYLSLKSYFE